MSFMLGKTKEIIKDSVTLAILTGVLTIIKLLSLKPSKIALLYSKESR